MENSKSLTDVFYKRINLNKGISIINYGTGVGKTHSTVEAIIKYLKENTYNNKIKDEDKNVIMYLSINNTSVNNVYDDFVRKVKEKNNESDFMLSDKEINKIAARLLSKPEVFKEKIKPALESIKSNAGNSKFNTNIINSKEFKTFELMYNNHFKYFYKKNKSDNEEINEYIESKKREALEELGKQDSKINKAYNDFRRKTESEYINIISEIKTSAKKEQIDEHINIENFKYCDEHKWIEEIFPDWYIYNKKVIFATAHKFNYPIKPLNKDGFTFINSSLINEGCVIMDESDTIYSILLSFILNNNYYGIGDIVTNSRTLINALKKNIGEEIGFITERTNVNQKLVNISSQIINLSNEIKAEGEALIEEFQMYNDFKAVGVLADEDKNVPLFLNREYFDVLYDNKNGENFLALECNKKINKNLIEAINYSTFYNEKNDKYINIIKFIDKAYRFEKKVIKLLNKMVSYNIAYRDNSYQSRDIDRDVLRSQAIKTVLNFLDLKSHLNDKSRYNDYLETLLKTNSVWIKHNETDIEDKGYFSTGFSYYTLINSSNHQTKSYIERQVFNTTPEKMLYDLQKKCHVILLSATAKLEGAYNNFMLGESLKKWNVDIMELDEEEWELGETIYEENTNNYDKINLNVEPIRSQKDYIGDGVIRDNWLRKYLENIASDNKKLEITSSDKVIIRNTIERINDFKISNYDVSKMLQIATVYEKFIKNSTNKIILLALNSYQKEFKTLKDSGLDKTVLTWLLDLIKSKYDKSNNVIFLEANANNISNIINVATSHISDGKRVILQTTYATASKGLNLQIEIKSDSFKKELISPTTSGFYKENFMDIGEIYFQKKTHIHTMINDDEEDEDTTYKDSKMNIATQMVEANRLIANKEIDEYYAQDIFKNIVKGSYKYGLLHDESASIAQFYWIVQVLGRLSRGGMKQKNINIYYDNDITNVLNYNILNNPKVQRTKELDLLINNILNNKKVSDILPSAFSQNIYSQIINANTYAINSINNFLSKRSQNELSYIDIKTWEERRRPPKNTYFGFSNNKDAYKDFPYYKYYIELSEEESLSRYYYTTNDNYRTINIYRNKPEKIKKPYNVSLKSIRYDKAINCPEVKEFLKQQGYLVDLDIDRMKFTIMPSPTECNNILKGALSEMVCTHILSLYGIMVDPIKDTNAYEDFDGVIRGTKIYVDFKNFAIINGGDRSRILEKTKNKMKKNDAKAVLFINMWDETDGKVMELRKNIFTFSGLITGTNNKNINRLNEKQINNLLEIVNKVEDKND